MQHNRRTVAFRLQRGSMDRCSAGQLHQSSCVAYTGLMSSSDSAADFIWTSWGVALYNLLLLRLFTNKRTDWRHTTKCGAGRICGADLNGDNCGSLRPISADQWSLSFTVRVRVGVRIRVRLGFGIGLRIGLGLRLVVYKLLDKVTKCGSITWSKLTNGIPPRRSAPLRILSCPTFRRIFAVCESAEKVMRSFAWMSSFVCSRLYASG